MCKAQVDIRLTHSKKPLAEPRIIHSAGSERARSSGSICASSDAGRPANAVRTRLVPWPYRFELEEDDQPDSALGSIGGFRFDRLLGKKLNEWPPYRDGSRQLGSTLRCHLPG
jgi:hypothetical protein